MRGDAALLEKPGRRKNEGAGADTRDASRTEPGPLKLVPALTIVDIGMPATAAVLAARRESLSMQGSAMCSIIRALRVCSAERSCRGAF